MVERIDREHIPGLHDALKTDAYKRIERDVENMLLSQKNSVLL